MTIAPHMAVIDEWRRRGEALCGPVVYDAWEPPTPPPAPAHGLRRWWRRVIGGVLVVDAYPPHPDVSQAWYDVGAYAAGERGDPPPWGSA